MAQLQLYLVGLGNSEGILLFDNKDNQQYKDYYVPVFPSMFRS